MHIQYNAYQTQQNSSCSLVCVNINIHHKQRKNSLKIIHNICMKVCWIWEIHILSESHKIHNYNATTLTLIVEHYVTTFSSEQIYSLLCQAREDKVKSTKSQALFLSYEGLFIKNEVTTLDLPHDSWAPSMNFQIPMWPLSLYMTL